ncbi:MAG: malto-oligosyltrehalose synthase [Planctomycetaceae bacterium]
MNDHTGLPMSTYRLQFNREFRFADAQRLVAYFSRLGVSHIYASPILRARKESTHGYDVVDPKTINPDMGDKNDLIGLVTDLRHFGLGLVLDIVPNHMAASIENPYWRDVLTYGRSSPYAGWFDINWRLPDPDMWGRVLAPILGEPRKTILERDQIGVIWSDGRFLIRYFEHFFPVDPATVPAICAVGLDELKQIVEEGHFALQKIQEILTALRRLPNLAARQRRNVAYNRDDVEHMLAELAQAIVQSPRIQQWAEETAARFSQGPEGRRRMRLLLDRQPYRLVYWRDAARAINYRRFFDINELISIRQEDPQVFDETHDTVLRWVHDGLIDGLRIDHIDGLRDPPGYLKRLAEALAGVDRARRCFPIFVEKILAHDERLPREWPVAGTTGYEFLNQVEASLISPSGFEAIEQRYRRLLNRRVQFADIAEWGKRRVLRNDLSAPVNPLADALVRLAERRRLIPPPENTENVAAAAAAARASSLPQRHDATDLGDDSPGGNPLRGAHGGDSPHDDDRRGDDAFGSTAAQFGRSQPTKRDFIEAIVEVATGLPVYRTYIDGRHDHVSESEQRMIESALERARQSGRAPPEAIDFLGRVLLLDDVSRLPDDLRNEEISFIQRFQQLTGPAAAKGIEDTALYAYVPLVSLNEVGGEPIMPADPIAELHQANEERAENWPRSMLSATTHDTKRSADVRARIDVLSELPDLWMSSVERWRSMTRNFRTRVDDKTSPDDAGEYLFYQTVVGLWPAPQPGRHNELPSADALHDLRERIKAYMLKAAREAKTRTSWTLQNNEYERALEAFVGNMLSPDGPGSSTFLIEVNSLVARIARHGFWNSLSRTLIQYTSPGTPDLYQGDELWNFAMVDPDNRRPVDYEARQRLLDEVIIGIESPAESRSAFVGEMVAAPEDGRVKLHLIHSALVARREHPSLFANSDYLPLIAEGRGKDHVIAFARQTTASQETVSGQPETAIVVVPRLTAGLVTNGDAPPIGEDVWSDTIIRLPVEFTTINWRCMLTREIVTGRDRGYLAVADLLKSFPAALVIGEADASPFGAPNSVVTDAPRLD